MANFAILRVAKLKNFGAVATSGQHNFRERETKNADGERLHLNQIEGAHSTAELVKAVSDRLPEKRRKDAVIGLEYLITASPEHFGADWRESKSHGQNYFADAIKWLEEKHGAENVVCKTVHLDESTPHMAVYVVPLKDGKLNAKAFTGGRKVLAEMQTSFAVEVGAKHDLKRGIERSNAVHQDNAKIQPIVVERMKLRKQVQTLEAEIELLTKRVGGGSEALEAVKRENEKLKEELTVAIERKEYFAAMAKRYETHKQQGGDVFDFEPNREPPRFVKDAEPVSPETFAESFARRTEEKRLRELAKQPKVAAPFQVSAERQQELERLLIASEAQPEHDRNALMDRWEADPATEAQQRMGTRGTIKATEGPYVVQHIGRGVHVCLTLAKGQKAPPVGSMAHIKDGQVVEVKVQERGGLSR